MNRRSRISIVLIITLLWLGCISSDTKGMTEVTKISPVLNRYLRSVEPVTILVEFTTPPYSEWCLLSQYSSVYQCPSAYQQTNQAIQQQFCKWLHRSGYEPDGIVSTHMLMNVLQFTVPGYAIPWISQYRSVQSISQAHLPWETSRNFVRKAWFDENTIPQEQDYPYTGKGIQVGIIDTGLDVGDEFYGRDIQGTNFAKIGEGWADNGYHGTAIAGIIGGNGPAWYQKGIAPHVNFRIYKVFSKEDYRPMGIIQAIEQSIQDRCQILNISLNGMDKPIFDGEESLVHKAISEAKQAGILVVVSSGNLAQVTEPGTFPEALTIGSADDRSLQVMQASIPGFSYPVKAYTGLFSLPFQSFFNHTPLVYAGFGTIGDFDETEAKDKIVLMDRGPTKQPLSFYEKINRAMEQGAKAVILVNNGPYLSNPGVNLEKIYTPSGEPILLENPYDDPSDRYRFKPYHQMIPSAMISQEDGRWIKDHLSEIQLTFQDSPLLTFGSSLSKGNTTGNTIKPDLLAPGEMIIAPYQKKTEESLSCYVMMQGSSASSAFVSGAIALVKEAHPEWNNEQVILALQNTATLLRNPISQLPYESVFQGAGCVQSDQAIHTETRMEPVFTTFHAGSSVPVPIEVSNLTNQSIRLPLQVECSQPMTEWIQLVRQQLPDSLVLEPGEKKILSISVPVVIKRSLDFWIHVGDAHAVIRVQAEKEEPPRPISGFSVSQTKLQSPLKKPVAFEFTLSECTLIGNSNKTIHQSAGIVAIRLLNRNKRFVTDIIPQSNAWLGKNVLLWDGIVSGFPLHISEGTYYFELTLYRYQITPQQTTQAVISDQVWAEVQITQSEGASQYLCVAVNRKTKQQEAFPLKLNFSRSIRFKQLEVEITFNPMQMVYQDIQLLSPWSDNQKIVIETQGSNAKGWLQIRMMAKDGETISVSAFQPFLLITMLPEQADLLSLLHISQLHLFDNQGNPIPVFSVPSSVEILEPPFLLADLNEDFRVNQEDREILWKHFGVTINDAEYDRKKDINQDGRIGPEEVMWMAKEWEQEIQP